MVVVDRQGLAEATMVEDLEGNSNWSPWLVVMVLVDQ